MILLMVQAPRGMMLFLPGQSSALCVAEEKDVSRVVYNDLYSPFLTGTHLSLFMISK